MRLTDEELSRVLTAHAREGLKTGGDDSSRLGYPACLLQVARRISVPWEPEDGTSLFRAASWFDDNYRTSWTTDEFLAALEAQELA